MTEHSEHYILATGQKDLKRLRLLNEVYGPGSQALFDRIGLCDGMRVAVVGCGSGNMTCWIAQRVAPGGSVVAIDISPDQIEQSRKQAQLLGLANIEFHVADAYSPHLPEGTFDVAYCRLVLMHLTRPADALKSMRNLVKPGGKVICEELDLGVWMCDPPADAMRSFFDLNDALGQRKGENFRLGASLHRLFREAGFASPEVAANFPLALRGEKKRLLQMTFVEFAPELVREGLATPAEVDRVSKEMLQLADDETTLIGFPLAVQAWGQR